MYYLYVYYCDKQPIYTGLTKYPITRYKRHLYENSKFKMVNHIKIASINSDNFVESRYYENYYIFKFKPLMNLKNVKFEFEDHGMFHEFSDYDIETFIEKFSNIKSSKKKISGFVYKGKTYKHESDFIRTNFPKISTRTIRYLKYKIMNKNGFTTSQEAYDYMLSKPLESLFSTPTMKKVMDYIKKHPYKKTIQIKEELGVSYDVVRDARERLISTGSINNK